MRNKATPKQVEQLVLDVLAVARAGRMAEGSDWAKRDASCMTRAFGLYTSLIHTDVCRLAMKRDIILPTDSQVNGAVYRLLKRDAIAEKGQRRSRKVMSLAEYQLELDARKAEAEADERECNAEAEEEAGGRGQLLDKMDLMLGKLALQAKGCTSAELRRRIVALERMTA